MQLPNTQVDLVLCLLLLWHVSRPPHRRGGNGIRSGLPLLNRGHPLENTAWLLFWRYIIDTVQALIVGVLYLLRVLQISQLWILIDLREYILFTLVGDAELSWWWVLFEPFLIGRNFLYRQVFHLLWILLERHDGLLALAEWITLCYNLVREYRPSRRGLLELLQRSQVSVLILNLHFKEHVCWLLV